MEREREGSWYERVESFRRGYERRRERERETFFMNMRALGWFY